MTHFYDLLPRASKMLSRPANWVTVLRLIEHSTALQFGFI